MEPTDDESTPTATAPPKGHPPEADREEPLRQPPLPPWRPFDGWRRVAHALRRFVVRRNPAYLISAALMIAGVYTLLRPGEQRLGNLSAILATFGTFQVYEFLLVGIALWLVCVRRVMDDGATLVLIEALFVVGCFIIVDEVTFRDGGLSLGLLLALVAAALAVVRLGALGGIVGRRLLLSAVGVVLLMLLVWNALTPAGLARMHDRDLATAGAAYHAGWWALTGLALLLAVVAQGERGRLWLRGEALVSSSMARWAVAGAVLLASAVHQYSMGYVLDREFLLSDLVPLATCVGFGAATLLARAHGGKGVATHVAALVPVVVCVLALASGQFEPMVGGPGRVLPPSSLHVHELRTLTWPTAWLWATVLLTLLLAWRLRSERLAHQGAAVAALAGLFLSSLLPDAVQLSPMACRLALAAYCLVGAVVYRSPWFTSGFLLIANYDVWRAVVQTPAMAQLISPHVVALGTVGASCFGLWWVFRGRVAAWVAHVGAGLMLSALVLAHALSGTRLTGLTLALAALGLAALFAAAARAYAWWPYYGLALLSLTTTGVRALERSGPSVGSSRGWLLVFAAFLALGLGFLISVRKTPMEEGAT